VSEQEAEAIKHIEKCLADLAHPTRQSIKRKRRTVAWLAHCVGELERMVNEGQARRAGTAGRRE